MVVVDSFSKMIECFPCNKTIYAKETAIIFLQDIFSRHGLPEEVISDQGPQFTSSFYQNLYSNLNIKPCLSTAFHPQSDGQTERINQVLEQYKDAMFQNHQDDWVSWIQVAQFAYDNQDHSATGYSPFFVNFGKHPRTILSPTISKVNDEAYKLLIGIEKVHRKSKSNCLKQ